MTENKFLHPYNYIVKLAAELLILDFYTSISYLIAIENRVDVGQVHGKEEVGGNWAHKGFQVFLKI